MEVHSDVRKRKTTENREDLVFETFYHKSGKEFKCMYLDGMRFYLDDWGSKEWQPFPKRWYDEGLLITTSVQKDQEKENRRRQQQQQQSSRAVVSRSHPHQPGYLQQSDSGQDDREGVLNHPKRGRIPTYIFQRKHNIHCFYDRDQGQWMRLPIGWELHHEMVCKLVDQVEEAFPAWGDRQDILALLRQCNYDPDECMSTYSHLEGDPWLKPPKTQNKANTAEGKDETIEKLRIKLKEAEETLMQERIARVEAENLVKEQEKRITDLEVENKQQEAQMMSLQQNRPEWSMQRPKTSEFVTEAIKEDTVNTEDIVLLNNAAKELRKSQVHLKMEVQRYFDVLRGQISKACLFVNVSPDVNNFSETVKDQEEKILDLEVGNKPQEAQMANLQQNCHPEAPMQWPKLSRVEEQENKILVLEVENKHQLAAKMTNLQQDSPESSMQCPKPSQVKEQKEKIFDLKVENKQQAAQMTNLQQDSPESSMQCPKPSQNHEDQIFETFYHKSGKEFQCMYLDGMRFYLDDWGSKKWQPFPKRWYNEGLLITNSVVKDQEKKKRRQQQQQQQSSGAGASGSRPQQPGYQQQSGSGQDDREGVINHPKRGCIPTYIFQRKHNIHCFYDRDQGQWMRLPIGWELHHEMVCKLVDQVEESLPAWGDRQDILALLRQCNYDPDECMSTYSHLEGDPWLKAPKTHKEAKAMEEKDKTIEKLRMQLKEAEENLKQERIARVEAEKLVKEQGEKITDLEAENKQKEALMMNLPKNRSKTPMQCPKTPQVGTQVVKEETVNPEDIVLLNNTAKELRKSQVNLKMEVQRYFDVLRGQIAEACVYVNVSPDVNDMSETGSTPNIGSNAKQVA